jgi:hypothetical protein
VSSQAPVLTEEFRLIVLRQDAAEILLTGESSPYGLPVIHVPRHTRVAQSVTEAVRLRWGIKIYCLFTLPRPTSNSILRYQVAEIFGPGTTSQAGTNWIPLRLLSTDSFVDPQGFLEIENALSQLRESKNDARLGFFGRLGWLTEIIGWIESESLSVGSRLTGQFRQLNASPTFSLVRFETTGQAIWFKAVGEPNLREFPITLKLAELFPDYVCRILATKPDVNGWLSLEVQGVSLDECAGTESWNAAADCLADLQIASFGKTGEFLEAGAWDVRPSTLLGLVKPFFEAISVVMRRQTKTVPPPLSREQLSTLQSQIEDALCALMAQSLPDTLGHIDANPGNIVISGQQAVFLDWAEACVGHPFFTFHFLQEYLRRHTHADDVQRNFVDSYLRPWEFRVARKELEEILKRASLCAVFAFAVSNDLWRSHDTEQSTDAYFRSLARRMKREADLFETRESICLS